MTNPTAPILAVSDLTVQRGEALILDKISWKIARGEHWVILGANGSGKTSLLSALTGYLTPSAGRIELLSKTYGTADWRELRKRVGLVSSAVRQMIPDEEIMPVFTHVLILQAGRAVAGGPKKAVLTSAALSRAFHAPLRLERRHRRYTLKLCQKIRGLM